MSPLLLAVSMLHPSDSQLPPMPYEFRAAWVATVDNIDWPSKRTLSTDEQKAELVRIMDAAVRLNLNAIVLQVRPSADALYPSKLEPWSEYLTNKQGSAPNPFYDPLEFAVQEAHKRSIELHVWLNPYRAKHPAQKGPLAGNHIANTNPSVVKRYGKLLWMDPGEKAVQDRSLAVARDIVRRYDIDGVHIDDYFYPYPEGSTPFPDDASYKASGTRLSRGDWRRKNVDTFVESLYRTIKKEKRWVKFGISPFGIYRPGVPEGIKAGVDQYADLYADARKWLNEGWCDYFTPQLYWPITQKAQSFPVLLGWWATENTQGRHLWPGLYTSRTMPSGGNWSSQEITNQIDLTRKESSDPGQVHFSMKALLMNANKIGDALRIREYSQPAFVPPSPWLGDEKPKEPSVVSNTNIDQEWVVKWKPASGIARWAVNTGTDSPSGTIWHEWIPVADCSWKAPAVVTYGPSYLAVRAISRTGIASDAVIVKLSE